MYYHASQIAGIEVLEPRTSNHNTPLIYFSTKRENVLVYLSNAIENIVKKLVLLTMANGINGHHMVLNPMEH